MKVFVTGGAGFIGSYLVDKLMEGNNVVTVYDNLSSGKKQFIEQHFKKNNFNFIEGDLLDLEKLKNSIKNHDVVFHIAANPFVRLGLNNIKKIVFSSSSVVYAETPPIAIPEDYGPTLPISLYGASKLAAEGLISAFCGTFDFQAWIFRFANVVGMRGTHGVIVDFINKLERNPHDLEILGDGKQQKPYLHATDIVDGILFAFNHSNERINLFNIGCDSNTTVTRIAKIIVEEMGLKDVKFKYTGGKRGWAGDVPRFQLSIEKMKKLGWKPKYTSDEAVRKAIREILNNK